MDRDKTNNFFFLKNIFLLAAFVNNSISEKQKDIIKKICTSKNPLKLGRANKDVAPSSKKDILFIEPIDVAFDHRF